MRRCMRGEFFLWPTEIKSGKRRKSDNNLNMHAVCLYIATHFINIGPFGEFISALDTNVAAVLNFPVEIFVFFLHMVVVLRVDQSSTCISDFTCSDVPVFAIHSHLYVLMGGISIHDGSL